MNRIITILSALLLLTTGCNDSQSEKKQTHSEQHQHDGHTEKKTYTCPMHPEIIRNEPGQCPICGMDLVEKKPNGKKSKDEYIEILLKPTNEYVIGNIKISVAKHVELPLEIVASGKISYDTREIYTVSARVSGWIEKLYVKYRFQPVVKGQKLMDIYSKELVTEQENFIFLLENDSDNVSLIQSAEKRLLLLGLTDKQVEEIRNTHKAFHSITIYSPYNGHLHEPSESDISSDGNIMNMNVPEKSNSELILREGMSVSKGQTVFTIYGLSRVWALINIYNENIGQIKTGMPVILIVNGEEINAVVGFIEPTLKENNTTAVRIYLNNSGQKLKPGMLINAKVMAGKINSLFISSVSVVHLGNSEVVFIKEGDIFRSRKVTTGIISGNYIEILSGINENDSIAENAQMLIDSESFIKSSHEE